MRIPFTGWDVTLKRSAAFGPARAAASIASRSDPLRFLAPDRLSRAIQSFRCGYLREMSDIIDALEERDDTTRSASRKAFAAASRCPHRVLIREGEERNPRAKLHQDILARFWAQAEVRDAYARNAPGGMRALKKGMAEALSRRWSVHEITWTPSAGGIRATFWRLPLSRFENRTGALRYLESDGSLEGRALEPGGWLIAQGDGVGVAAAVAAVSKRLSLQDWLLYSERCGQPGVHARTDAAAGSPEWEALLRDLNGLVRDWKLLTDKGVELTPVPLSTPGTLPYPELIARMDRAIAALYRGADLSTVSGGAGGDVGASLQGDETDILDSDTCEMISEALQRQVDPFVIRWACGDAEPLAHISVSLPERPFTALDLQADETLLRLGARLSRRQALQRYGRTEAAEDEPDDALHAPEAGDGTLNAQRSTLNAQPETGAPEPLPHEKGAALALADEAIYEAAALEALAAARAGGLEALTDMLLEALDAPDGETMMARLQAAYDALPAMAGDPDADRANAELAGRIILGAVRQGREQSGKK
ncbi:MAG TPA: DUF935 family protein [Kiritimatiellia bacterium]|nr:DUF935 family protein [Kiritimatiellia bacterium]